MKRVFKSFYLASNSRLLSCNGLVHEFGGPSLGILVIIRTQVYIREFGSTMLGNSHMSPWFLFMAANIYKYTYIYIYLYTYIYTYTHISYHIATLRRHSYTQQTMRDILAHMALGSLGSCLGNSQPAHVFDPSPSYHSHRAQYYPQPYLPPTQNKAQTSSG